MSTILDALKKLQREKAAQSPSRDLRGSVASETPWPRARRGGGASRALVWVALLALLGGGGYWAYSSGKIGSLVARVRGGGDSASDEAIPSDAELDALEREMRANEAQNPPDAAQETPPAPPAVAAQPAPPAAAAPPPRAVAIPNAPPAPATPETPEMTAERARLEATIAQAREAQEAQRRADLAAAAAAAAAPPPPAPATEPATEIAEPDAEAPPAPTPPAPAAAVAPKPAPAPAPAQVAKAPAPAKRAPVAKPKPAASKPAAAPPRPKPPVDDAEGPAPSVAFPSVLVESIRWHPIPERRVASLRFEQQNVPEAHEGDIVAGVLVYRIDPGAVELRIGESQRIVRPGS